MVREDPLGWSGNEDRLVLLIQGDPLSVGKSSQNPPYPTSCSAVRLLSDGRLCNTNISCGLNLRESWTATLRLADYFLERCSWNMSIRSWTTFQGEFGRVYKIFDNFGNI